MTARLTTGTRTATYPSHHDASTMWGDLGNHWTWEGQEDSGQVVHPICTEAQLDELTDEQIVRLECPADACASERAAHLVAVVYARTALADMRSIASDLEAAVDAWEVGDLPGTLERLRDAASAESEYGASPAADALRAQLVVEEVEEDDEAAATERVSAVMRAVGSAVLRTVEWASTDLRGDIATDIAVLRNGTHTAESLLAHCLDGVEDEVQVADWRVYVSALVDVATPS